MARFASGLLLATGDASASAAAARLVGTSESIGQRYGPRAAEMWADQYRDVVRELAAAVAVERPDFFGERMAWTAAGFRARGVPTSDLCDALMVLGSVLEREIPASDRAVVTAALRAGVDAVAASESRAEASHINATTAAGRLAAEYLVAVLEGRRSEAVDTVTAAVREGRIAPKDAYLRVLAAAQREIGRLWHAGEINVPEEHAATATTQTALSLLREMLPRAASNGKTVVAACTERNAHELGLRMVADFFEAAGWRSVFLGANLPREDVVTALTTFDADLLALSASLRPQIECVREAIAQVRDNPATAGVKIVVGGSAFAGCGTYWRSIGADGFAADPDGAVAEGARLVGLRQPPSA